MLKLQSSRSAQVANAAIYASVRASQDAKDSLVSNADSQQVKQPANYTALSFHGAMAAYKEAANASPE